MKGKLLILLTVLFLSIACNFQGKKTHTEDMQKPQLPPLDSAVINYQDKQPFDTLLHLTGEKVSVSDSLLKEISSISFEDNHVVLHKNFQDIIKKFPVGNDEFICIRPYDSTIIRATSDGDYKKIYRLKLQPNSGTLIVDTSVNRMIFAYSYYHVFQIMDLEAKTVKTIDFEGGNYKYKFAGIMDAPDPNILYYTGAFAGNDYFYLLYWGYSPKLFWDNIYKRWQMAGRGQYVKPPNYQYDLPNIVEQYDWNGNPINRYLLEGENVGSGCFVVDEKERRFYLLVSECYKYAPFIVGMECMASNESLITYQF